VGAIPRQIEIREIYDYYDREKRKRKTDGTGTGVKNP
jgi:hypothetical protein